MKPVSHQTAALRAEFYLTLFYGMGPDRSLARLPEYASSAGQKDVPSYKTIRRWSAEQKWTERVRALDAEAVARQTVRAIDTAVEINSRHAVLAQARQNVAAQVIRGFQQNPAKLAEVSLGEASRVMSEATKDERMAAGLATERSEIIVGVWTVVIEEIAALFMRVNGLEDAEVRKAEFAHGFDEVAKAHVAGYLSPGREEE